MKSRKYFSMQILLFNKFEKNIIGIVKGTMSKTKLTDAKK